MKEGITLALILYGLVDFLLILGTNRLVGRETQFVRAIIASAVGVFWAGLSLRPGLAFLGRGLWQAAALTAVGWIALRDVRGRLTFLGLSLGIRGLAVAVCQGSVVKALFFASVLWLILLLGAGEAGGLIPISIREGEREVRLKALRDTGNTLRDPITGSQVTVICASAAEVLTGLTRQQLKKPLETLTGSGVPGLRLIPYRCVGGGGLLLAKTYEDVTVDSRRHRAVIAFDPGELGEGEDYQALTGGAV